MRRVLAGWMAACAMGAAFAQAPAKVIEFDVSGNLTIDEQGAVREYDIAAGRLPESITKVVGASVKQWRFEPILHDGKPVVAKSPMYLFLTATPVDAGYRLRVERVQFGMPRKPRTKRSTNVGAVYPREAMQARIGADLLIAVRIDAEGNVVDAAPLRSRLVPQVRSATLDAALRGKFERNVTDMVRKLQFEAADPARGDKPEVAFVMPVTLLTTPRTFTPLWTAADKALTSEATPAWFGGTIIDASLERLKEGQTLAADTAFVLRTQVVGTTL